MSWAAAAGAVCLMASVAVLGGGLVLWWLACTCRVEDTDDWEI